MKGIVLKVNVWFYLVWFNFTIIYSTHWKKVYMDVWNYFYSLGLMIKMVPCNFLVSV